MQKPVLLNPPTYQVPDSPKWMCICNITPDSFSDGGCLLEAEAFYQHALTAIQAGASYLDIGAESSRPYAEAISSQTEIERLSQVREAVADLKKVFPEVLVSLDTVKASVAQWGLDAGWVDLINDVSGGAFQDDDSTMQMFDVVAEQGCSMILMHRRGDASTMESLCEYGDAVQEVGDELARSIEVALRHGVKREQLMVDVGIGFAKTEVQNRRLIQELPHLKARLGGLPFLLGVSRKRLVSGSGVLAPYQREATTALLHHVIQREHPAGTVEIFRVHDVLQQKTAWDFGISLNTP